MATTLTNFTSETQIGATATVLVSTTSSEQKFMGNATVTNTSTLNVEVTFWRILSATTATDGSGGDWIWKETIPAKKTVRISKIIGHVLGNSMKIEAIAGTASVINADLSGTTET